MIAAEAYDKFNFLITMFDKDLDDAKLIYLKCTEEETDIGTCLKSLNTQLTESINISWSKRFHF